MSLPPQFPFLPLAFLLAMVLLGCRTEKAGQSPLAIPQFQDVTQSAGIHFRHTSGASAMKYLVEIVGPGVGVLDFDNDGWMDLLFVNGHRLIGSGQPAPTLRLYRNLGKQPLQFEDVTARAGLAISLYGMGCAVGDYDGDGWSDLYVSAVLGPGKLFHNRHGKFEDVTEHANAGNAGRWGTGCVWLDYDRDGKLDLYVGNYVRYTSLKDDVPCIVRDNKRSYCVPIAYDGSRGTLYRNLGEGRFADVTVQAGLDDPRQKALGVTTTDVDDDGWTDLLIANDTVPNRCFRNRNGKFEEVAVEAGVAFGPGGKARAGMGLDAADWRNDGMQTIAFTYFAQESIGFYVQSAPGELFFNDESAPLGIAAPSAPLLGFGIRFLDWDNDGFQDLCAVNGHIRDDIEALEPGQRFAQPALLFRNYGGQGFQDVTTSAGAPFTTPAVRRSLATADFNNDGQLDLVTTQNNGPAELWQNQTSTSAHWLGLHLRGTRSVRDAIGARVSVSAGGRKQTAWVRSGGGYLSESDRRLHFGLGPVTKVDEITVRWPMGQVERFPGGAVDRFITLEEGRAE